MVFMSSDDIQGSALFQSRVSLRKSKLQINTLCNDTYKTPEEMLQELKQEVVDHKMHLDSPVSCGDLSVSEEDSELDSVQAEHCEQQQQQQQQATRKRSSSLGTKQVIKQQQQHL